MFDFRVEVFYQQVKAILKAFKGRLIDKLLKKVQRIYSCLLPRRFKCLNLLRKHNIKNNVKVLLKKSLRKSMMLFRDLLSLCRDLYSSGQMMKACSDSFFLVVIDAMAGSEFCDLRLS